jgi:hypothetical protein
MALAYTNCKNLTTAVCGPNVIYMTGTYMGCSNLQNPTCGPNVEYLVNAYTNCFNLKTSLCGEKVISLANAYYNCYNITGNAACSSSVINMSNAYRFCRNLTNATVGTNVRNMRNAYAGCINLKTAACGDNVVDMASAYSSCVNLMGTAVCGNKVTTMYETYNLCRNITSAVCGKNVKNMINTFNGCSNLANIVIYALTPPSIHSTRTFYGVPSTTPIYVHANVLSTYQSATNWSNYASRLKAIPVYIEDTKNAVYVFNTSTSYSIPYSVGIDGAEIEVSVSSSDSSIVSVDNVSVNKDTSSICFTTHTLATEGVATITVAASTGEETYSTNFTVKSLEEMLSFNYSIEAIENINYGFTLNNEGYYESENTGKTGPSYAMCQINIVADGVHNLYLDYILDAKTSTDGVLFSYVNMTLETNSASSDVALDKTIEAIEGTIKTDGSVDYGVLDAGEYFIQVKFYINYGANSKNSSLQFKVRTD